MAARPTTTRAPSELTALVAVGAVFCAVAGGAYFGFDLAYAGSLWFPVIAGSPAVVAAALAVALTFREGAPAAWLKPIWGDPTRGILSAAVLMLASVAFVHVVTPVGSPRESWIARLYLQIGSPDALKTHVGALALTVILVVTAEEIVWRGWLPSLLAPRVGTRVAWVYSALLYALSLVPTMWSLRDPVAGLNPIVPLAALALGFAWGAMARFTGRLIPSILSHIAFDWCAVVMFRLWGPSV